MKYGQPANNMDLSEIVIFLGAMMIFLFRICNETKEIGSYVFQDHCVWSTLSQNKSFVFLSRSGVVYSCPFWHLMDQKCIWKIQKCMKTRRVDGTPTSEATRSLSHRSLNLTLVTKWSWSWMTFSHPLCSMSIGPLILRAIHGQGHVCGQRSRSHLTLKFKGQGHCQTHWSHLRPGVQSTCLLLVLRPSDHFWLRYSKFHIWPWTFKVKVMAKVKHDGHIWGI